MPTKNNSPWMQRDIFKYMLAAVLGLAVTGAASVINRNVYSKEQVDMKDAAVIKEVDHVRAMQKQQNKLGARRAATNAQKRKEKKRGKK